MATVPSLGHVGLSILDTDRSGRFYTEFLCEHDVEFLGEPVGFRPGVWELNFRGLDREVCELHDVSGGHRWALEGESAWSPVLEPQGRIDSNGDLIKD